MGKPIIGAERKPVQLRVTICWWCGRRISVRWCLRCQWDALTGNARLTHRT